MKGRNSLYARTVQGSSQRAMEQLKQGKIRKHKLYNSALEHKGEFSEQELYLFLDYLPTKNFYDVLELRGSINYE